MPVYYILLLAGHVLFGTIGVICYYAVWSTLASPKAISMHVGKWCFSGMVALLLALLSGGLYYVSYYSFIIQQIIGNGATPWAHFVLMDTKEHVFFFMVFLSMVISAAVYLLRADLEIYPPLRKAVTHLTGLLVILGIFIMLSGMAISGAVK